MFYEVKQQVQYDTCFHWKETELEDNSVMGKIIYEMTQWKKKTLLKLDWKLKGPKMKTTRI